MNKYNSWNEGYFANGKIVHAKLVATDVEGEDFRDACQRYYKNDVFYNKKYNSYWESRLYPDKEKASKRFG